MNKQEKRDKGHKGGEKEKRIDEEGKERGERRGQRE